MTDENSSRPDNVPDNAPQSQEEAAVSGHSDFAGPLSEQAEELDQQSLQAAAPDRAQLVTMAIVFEGGLGVLALLLTWLLGLRWPGSQLQWHLGQLLLALGTGTLLALLLLLGLRGGVPWLKEMARMLDLVLGPALKQCSLLDIVLIATLAGIGEELMFRCVVQAAVAAVVGGNWGMIAGLAVAAMSFGLLHPLTRAYIVLASIFGLLLGVLWLATDNLLVPIVAHGWYDSLALAYLARATASEKPAQ